MPVISTLHWCAILPTVIGILALGRAEKFLLISVARATLFMCLLCNRTERSSRRDQVLIPEPMILRSHVLIAMEVRIAHLTEMESCLRISEECMIMLPQWLCKAMGK